MRDVIGPAIEEVRGMLNPLGGDVVLLDVHEGVVHVQLLGACDSDRCRFTLDGLRQLVESALQQRCPDVRGVVAC